MIDKVNKSISEVLDIEESIEDNACILIDPDEQVPECQGLDSDVNSDVEYARENIKSLIASGTNAIAKLIKVAEESEHPRAYEVVATLLKNLGDLNKDLIEVHKKKKDLLPKDYSKNQNINVDKAVVFTGSTKELIKLIKQNKDE